MHQCAQLAGCYQLPLGQSDLTSYVLDLPALYKSSAFSMQIDFLLPWGVPFALRNRARANDPLHRPKWNLIWLRCEWHLLLERDEHQLDDERGWHQYHGDLGCHRRQQLLGGNRQCYWN